MQGVQRRDVPRDQVGVVDDGGAGHPVHDEEGLPDDARVGDDPAHGRRGEAGLGHGLYDLGLRGALGAEEAALLDPHDEGVRLAADGGLAPTAARGFRPTRSETWQQR